MTNPFQILRDALKKRAPFWGGEKIPIAFRFMELAGEAGEAANAGKKLARHELGMVGGSNDLTNLREELGDVIICCELIAAEYDIDLWAAVKDKFNKTSDKMGFPVRIDSSGEFFWKKCSTCDAKIIAFSVDGESQCPDCRM